MLHQLPAQTTFQVFLETINKLCSSDFEIAAVGKYVLLFLTFKGCYSSVLSKERFLNSVVAEQLSLIEIDIRTSPQVYKRLAETMPTVILAHKLPVHLFCKINTNTVGNLEMTPLLRNFTTLGDTHFRQIKKLLEE